MNTHAEINLNNIKDNIAAIKKLLDANCRFMAVVKANAYGHGSVAVANLKEAMEIREAGITSPILILTESPTSVMDEIIQYDLTQTVYSYAEAKALSDEAAKRNKSGKVHVKIDTGMGRVGVMPSEAMAYISKISSLPSLTLEGLFTHFAKAEDPQDHFTKGQFNLFKQIADRLPKIPLKHSANSAAVLYHPETHLDLVRVGLMMYGLYPLGNGRNKVSLKPALSFKSRVTYLKKVPAGTPVSYADGYSRRLSNRGKVIIRGKRYPVVGNVTMDLIMVDVSNSKVAVGDEVFLIGEQNSQMITTDEIAQLDDTISYEVVCGIGKRVPRIYK